MIDSGHILMHAAIGAITALVSYGVGYWMGRHT